MFEHRRRFSRVLPEHRYRDRAHLLATLGAVVIRPVERWERKTNNAAARVRLLRDAIQTQQAEISRRRTLVEGGDQFSAGAPASRATLAAPGRARAKRLHQSRR